MGKTNAVGIPNRLRVESAERRLPFRRLRKCFPPDMRQQLIDRGLEPGSGTGHAAVFDGLYRVEVTGRLNGREVRISATAERKEDLWPNLLRAFG